MKQTRGEGDASRALAQLANNQGGTITAEQYLAAVGIAGLAYEGIQAGRNKRGRGDQREERLQSQIVQLARLQGWAVYHTFDSRHSVAGFPDLELSRIEPRPRIIKAELKDETNKPTREQIDWLNLYAAMGGPIEVFLWRPAHWDAIVEILKPEWKRGDGAGDMLGLWAPDVGAEPLRGVPSHAGRGR